MGGEVPEEAHASKQDDRFRSLIGQSPVMLFMKGTPEKPRCGFSRQMVALLKEQSVKFGSFDILSDMTVRQGLKKFSEWPTFPQLYIDNELVGGLDIVREQIADGDFEEQIPAASKLAA